MMSLLPPAARLATARHANGYTIFLVRLVSRWEKEDYCLVNAKGLMGFLC